MRRDSKGIALVTALAILVVVSLLVLGTVFSTQIQSWTTRNDTTSTQAYYIAHAGLEKYKTIAFQSFRFYLDNLQHYGSALGTSAICGNLLSSGLDINRNFVIDSSDGDLMPGGSRTESYGGGTYTVTFTPDGSNVILTSVGKIHGAKATDQVVFEPKNAGIFSNALFAGGGISSKYINGGAQVWGSVYIQGPDPTAVTNPPTVISSNGDFGMHNFYDDSQLLNLMGNKFTDNQLQSMLGATATDQKDLCAHLRVAYGQVDTGGNTTIGDSTAPSGYKSSLQGLNVSSGATDISSGGSSTIYADNYPNGNLGYDLTKTMQLPTFAGPCKTGNSWGECLQRDAKTYTSDASTNPGGCDLSTIASGTTLDFDSTPISCVIYDSNNKPVGGFSYQQGSDGSDWNLNVYGLVNFNGYDLHFAKNVAARFSGKATIMVTQDSGGTGGNITVDGDILPSTHQVCDPTCHTPSFPDDEVLGLIAQNDLTFTGVNENQLLSSTQTAVGLFYAGNQASVQKGGVVMGTVIAKGISTSSGNAGQTAKVIQVPGLEYNLAPGFTDLPNDLEATFRILAYERR
ncbi:MAG TPA: PilX N-terminal domain-containing pilus assembly protein [Trueperaceae bacterium]|nr:PilX N-terminal domain-containing pilus assembly protein [Trueperaceae bacterium]